MSVSRMNFRMKMCCLVNFVSSFRREYAISFLYYICAEQIVGTPASAGDPTDSNILVLVFKKIQEQLLFSAKFSSKNLLIK